MKIIVDDFDMEGIWRKVYGALFMTFIKKRSTLRWNPVVKEKGLFDCERITLWKLLRKFGFRYKQVNDKRYVYEQPRIIVQRHEYFRRMRRNRREGRPVVYLDETWANARDSVEKMWVEDDPVVSGGTIGGFRKP